MRLKLFYEVGFDRWSYSPHNFFVGLHSNKSAGTIGFCFILLCHVSSELNCKFWINAIGKSVLIF